jgi:hypothetical protein
MLPLGLGGLFPTNPKKERRCDNRLRALHCQRPMRRPLAVAAIFDGATRMEAAKIAGVTAQTVREWNSL